MKQYHHIIEISNKYTGNTRKVREPDSAVAIEYYEDHYTNENENAIVVNIYTTEDD